MTTADPLLEFVREMAAASRRLDALAELLRLHGARADRHFDFWKASGGDELLGGLAAELETSVEVDEWPGCTRLRTPASLHLSVRWHNGPSPVVLATVREAGDSGQDWASEHRLDVASLDQLPAILDAAVAWLEVQAATMVSSLPSRPAL